MVAIGSHQEPMATMTIRSRPHHQTDENQSPGRVDDLYEHQRGTQRRTLRRSAATAARPGPPGPALHPQEDRQVPWGSPVDRGTGDEVPGSWPTAEPGSQGSGAAVPVGEAGRHDPCRHQTAGPVPAVRSPDHRRPPTRLFPGRWLREGALRGG